MDRPCQSAHQPVEVPQLVAPEPAPQVSKRKPTHEVNAAMLVKTLLESPESDLVSLDMHVHISAGERSPFCLVSLVYTCQKTPGLSESSRSPD